MTSKQRAAIKSMANGLKPIFQIGKGGIGENLISDLSDALEKYELIKISVLQNSEKGAKDILSDLAEKLGAEPIAAVGNKIVLYRHSKREDIKHIEF